MSNVIGLLLARTISKYFLTGPLGHIVQQLEPQKQQKTSLSWVVSSTEFELKLSRVEAQLNCIEI